jgi:hypothetical protein
VNSFLVYLFKKEVLPVPESPRRITREQRASVRQVRVRERKEKTERERCQERERNWKDEAGGRWRGMVEGDLCRDCLWLPSIGK